MNRTTIGVAALTVILSAAHARGQDWAGVWRVEDGGERVVTAEGTGYSLSVDWPGHGQRRFIADASAARATFKAAIAATPGLVGALEGRGAGEDRLLRIEARRSAPGEDEAIRAEVTWTERGRVARRERWTKAVAPSIEIIDVTPLGEWQPKDGPCVIRFRVRGAPLAVRLRALLERGDGLRERFYEERPRDERGRARVIAEREVEGGRALEVGEHETSWDGRDDTAARRLSLQGRYLVTLVGGDARAERAVTVAAPRSEYLGPRWPKRVDPAGKALDPGRDRTEAFAAFRSASVRGDMAEPRATLGPISGVTIIDALERAALVTVATHGSPGKVWTYVAPDEIERGESQESVDRVRLEARATAEEPKPFRDVHMTVLWGCSIGAVTSQDMSAAHRGQRGEDIASHGEGCRCDARPAAEGGLPCPCRRHIGDRAQPRERSALIDTLLARGVDVVVSFTELVHTNGHAEFMASLARLAGRSNRRSVAEAARHAAHAVDHAAWGWWKRPCAARWQLRHEGMTPLEESIRVDAAPDIDPTEERLYPPRWGNSTN